MEGKQKRQADMLENMLHAAEHQRQEADMLEDMLEEKHNEQLEELHKQQADMSEDMLEEKHKRQEEKQKQQADMRHTAERQRQEELSRSRGGMAAEEGGQAPEGLGVGGVDKNHHHDPSASAQADSDVMMQYISEARTGWEEYPQHTALRQLSGTCARREEGWWHYEVCHGHNVTQYHPKDPACVTCAPERTSVHLLGTFAGVLPFMAASQAQAQAASEAGSGAKYWAKRSQEGSSGEGSERNAEHGTNRKRHADRAAFQAHEGSEGKHAFVDGDECGGNTARRNTLVEYRCLAGAGAGLTDDRIEMIEEYQTCRYRIILLTNKACNSSLQVSIT